MRSWRRLWRRVDDLSAELPPPVGARCATPSPPTCCRAGIPAPTKDRKSTRLNSSHSQISYAVFCLKKKQHLPAEVDQVHGEQRAHDHALRGPVRGYIHPRRTHLPRIPRIFGTVPPGEPTQPIAPP